MSQHQRWTVRALSDTLCTDAVATKRRRRGCVAFVPGRGLYTSPEDHGSAWGLILAGVAEDMIGPGIELLGALSAR